MGNLKRNIQSTIKRVPPHILNTELNFSYHRDASFDYCYNYYKRSTGIEISNDIEKSCLVIYYYLASWGMLRNSFLLNKSWKHFIPLVNYLAEKKSGTDSPWDIDVDNYTDENIKNLLELYKDIKKEVVPQRNDGKQGYAHLTLVTKIMLGVFGNIPAFDTYFLMSFKRIFSKECSFDKVNEPSLMCIKRFYLDNKEEVDKESAAKLTIDILTEKFTDLKYPKAKIIDLYGFCDGYLEAKEKSDNLKNSQNI